MNVDVPQKAEHAELDSAPRVYINLDYFKEKFLWLR